MSGIAIASPTRLIVLICSFSTSSSAPWPVYRSMSTIRYPDQNPMNVPSSAAPCISGGAQNMVSWNPSGSIRAASSSGEVTGVPTGLPPPMPAKNRSSWRHMTPLGIPVVPPV